MCRNIKVLFNFDPPATEAEIHAAATQFVRKVSGFKQPSSQNQEAFETAEKEITQAVSVLLSSLKTIAQPKDRDIQATKAHARAIKRFGG